MNKNLKNLLVVAGLGLTLLNACNKATNPAATTNGSANNGSSNSSGNNPGGNSGTNQGGGLSAIALISISTVSTSLVPGKKLQLVAVAKDAAGNIIASATITFKGNNTHIAEVSSNGLVEARYPGQVSITAEANGVTSAPFDLTVNSHANNLDVIQLTDNNVEDHWGANNDFKTISRDRVLWLQHDNNGMPDAVLISDTAGNVELDHDVAGLDDVDFLGLGSGAGSGDVMATWREQLQDTYVSNGAGGTTNNLGAQNAEENGIADGCLVYRDSSIGGTDDNDIAQYSFNNGLAIISQKGPEDSDPITSECETVWVRDGALVYFDGASETVISNGPFFGHTQFDFRHGRIVYALNGDIFLVDTTTIPFTNTQITNDGAGNGFPRTDGHSIVWIKDNIHINLYNITAASTRLISTTTAIKLVSSLHIDGKQVIWQDGNGDLFFNNGNGTPAGTSEIDPSPATNVQVPYISDGVVTWFGNTGVNTDTEIFILQ